MKIDWKTIYNRNSYHQYMEKKIQNMIDISGFKNKLNSEDFINFWKKEYYYFQNTKSIYEIGCGCGSTLKTLSYLCPHIQHFGGIDFSEELLTIAKHEFNQCNFHNSDIKEISFKSMGLYDTVISFSVLQYLNLEETSKIINELLNNSAVKKIYFYDVPNLKYKKEDIEFRKKYNYPDSNHTYYDSNFFIEFTKYFKTNIIIENQSIENYENSQFRFNIKFMK